jgi:hypothetical protein
VNVSLPPRCFPARAVIRSAQNCGGWTFDNGFTRAPDSQSVRGESTRRLGCDLGLWVLVLPLLALPECVVVETPADPLHSAGASSAGGPATDGDAAGLGGAAGSSEEAAGSVGQSGTTSDDTAGAAGVAGEASASHWGSDPCLGVACSTPRAGTSRHR